MIDVRELIARLKLEPGAGSSDADLDKVEAQAGVRLPAPFRLLWRDLGGAPLGVRVARGPSAGGTVAKLWTPAKILDRLEDEDAPLGASAGAAVVPFADDLGGNWYYLVDKRGDGIADTVELMDWDDGRVRAVAPTFEEFVSYLEAFPS